MSGALRDVVQVIAFGLHSTFVAVLCVLVGEGEKRAVPNTSSTTPANDLIGIIELDGSSGDIKQLETLGKEEVWKGEDSPVVRTGATKAGAMVSGTKDNAATCSDGGNVLEVLLSPRKVLRHCCAERLRGETGISHDPVCNHSCFQGSLKRCGDGASSIGTRDCTVGEVDNGGGLRHKCDTSITEDVCAQANSTQSLQQVVDTKIDPSIVLSVVENRPLLQSERENSSNAGALEEASGQPELPSNNADDIFEARHNRDNSHPHINSTNGITRARPCIQRASSLRSIISPGRKHTRNVARQASLANLGSRSSSVQAAENGPWIKGRRDTSREQDLILHKHPVFLKTCACDVTANGKSLVVQSKSVTPLSPAVVRKRFASLELLTKREAYTIIREAAAVLNEEQNILELLSEQSSPVVVVGDIHGQYSDLLPMLDGVRSDLQANSQTGSFLFLGDYVDRGPCSCEVMLLLLAMKLEAPKRVHLLRGNHECSNLTKVYGFKMECVRKYGEAMYYEFLACFRTLPLSAVVTCITRTAGGIDTMKRGYTRYFCVHGGLSPELVMLSDINALERREEPGRDSALADLLWSDPSDDPGVLEASKRKRREQDTKEGTVCFELDQEGFEVNPLRGLSYTFGASAASKFLATNDLDHLLRAHSVQARGFFQHFSPVENKTPPSQIPFAPPPSPSSPSKDVPALIPEPEREPEPELYSPVRLTHVSPCCGAEVTREVVGKGGCSVGQRLAMVSTVFSAPRYGGRENNQGAVVCIGGGKWGAAPVTYTFDGASEVQGRPKDGLVIAIRAIECTCPYLPTDFGSWLEVVLRRDLRKRVHAARDRAGEVTFDSQECVAIRRLFAAMADPCGRSSGNTDPLLITQPSLAEFDRVTFKGKSCNRVNDIMAVLAPGKNPSFGVTPGQFLFTAAAFKAALGNHDYPAAY
ncbi:unnamed protein product [Choristocarpus tenellus]